MTLREGSNEIRVCFVCAGNICRSPTAEAIMKQLLDTGGMTDRIHVESAGTYANGGSPPDARSAAAAHTRGVALDGRSQPVSRRHFAEFDYLIAMDTENLRDLTQMAPSGHRARIQLLLDFDANAASGSSVPDPYYGEDGFDRVFDFCDTACRGLLAQILADRPE